MLSSSFPFRSRSRFDRQEHRVSTLLASRLARSVVVATLLFCILLALFGSALHGHDATNTAAGTIVGDIGANASAVAVGGAKYGRLHLLVPATSSNPDLCKLLLSAQVLGYPTPVLINFGHPEASDGYIQHLAKVEGILEYLDGLPIFSEEDGEDLVLIVDGFDVWFQLHRDVLIKRYYALNEAADARTSGVYGEQVFHAYDMRQTIVFGPDKICWPIDFSRPACWAVPETTLSRYAFGPQTAQGREEHNQPRWLNSGTIMGPVRDLKDFLRATREEIRMNHTTDSDQFYMAEVFGRQEYARLQRKPELMAYYMDQRYGEEQYMPEWNITRQQPNMNVERTEYHIGIDYESSMFQTLAFWKQYLTWTRAADAWPSEQVVPSKGHNGKLGPVNGLSYYQMRLADGVVESNAPFSALPVDQAPDDMDMYQSWSEVELLYNVVTKQTPVSIHFTGEKDFRQTWWQRLWFQNQAEKLRLASIDRAAAATHLPNESGGEAIGGYHWHNEEPPEAEGIRMRGLGGAWSDIAGGWFSWKGLCQRFEGDIYHVRGDDFFHPPPTPPEQPPEQPQEQPGDTGGEDQSQEGRLPQHEAQPADFVVRR